MSAMRNAALQDVLKAGASAGHWFGDGSNSAVAFCPCGIRGPWEELWRHRTGVGCAEIEKGGQLPTGTAGVAAELLCAGFSGTLDDLAIAAGALVPDAPSPVRESLENPSSPRLIRNDHGSPCPEYTPMDPGSIASLSGCQNPRNPA